MGRTCRIQQGKTIHIVRELTVAEVFGLVQDGADLAAALARSCDLSLKELDRVPQDTMEALWAAFSSINAALLTEPDASPKRPSADPAKDMAYTISAMIEAGHANALEYPYGFFLMAVERAAGKGKKNHRPMPSKKGDPSERKAGHVSHLKEAFLKKFPDGVKLQ